MKSTPTEVNINKLKLDVNNPRFAELYSGSKDENELIEYLLYSESAEDVAKGITNADEFYPDRPLWVIEKDGHYLVKDGNRRCAAAKALNHPSKYEISLPMRQIDVLPVLIYNNEEDINSRILQEHTNNLFKEWDRIAKALEVYKMHASGSSLESMKEIDSQPSQLIKLASFYYAAVKIAGDDLKKLLRRGRGKSGGKTIIFERLFSYSKKCGYSFRNKPSYNLVVNEKPLFDKYIKALVKYLQENPKTKTQNVDEQKDKFLNNLEPFGFQPKKPSKNKQTASSDSKGSNEYSNDSKSSTNNDDNSRKTPQNSNTQRDARLSPDVSNKSNKSLPTARYSVKHKPSLKRKQIPAALKKIIDECYNLDQDNFANGKTALTRVTLECSLKYVVENTMKPNGKPLKTSNHFDLAFKDRKGNPLAYTNFDALKTKFTELIKDVGVKKAFNDFDIQNPHQIIHNYRVGAVPATAKALCDNLIDLLEFLLQEESDLVNSLDSQKL